MALANETIVGLEAIGLTHKTLWYDSLDQAETNEQMQALVEKAGSPAMFISGILSAGDVLLRTVALAANISPEEAIEEMLETLS